MNETRFYFIIDDNMAITGEAITKSNITITTILYAKLVFFFFFFLLIFYTSRIIIH